MSKPFARASAMMALIGAMLQQGLSMPFIEAQVGPYRSRGKGRGVFSGRYDARKIRQGGRSKYQPHHGKAECARRVRQMGGAA